MQFAVLRERMLQAIVEQNRIFLILLIINILDLVVKSIYYLKTKSNAGVSLNSFMPWVPKRKQRYSTKQQIGRCILAISVILVILIVCSAPAIFDIVTSNYTECKGEYYRPESSSTGNMFTYEQIYISVNDTRLTLLLPDGFSEEEFPYGTCSGTVIYGEKSRIILSFTQDESTD